MAYETLDVIASGDANSPERANKVRSNFEFLANPPKVSVYNSGNISVANGTDQPLTFDSERFDTDTMHSTSVNSGRLTIVTAGTYLVGFSVVFATNSTGIRNCAVRRNGTTAIISESKSALSGFSTTVNGARLYAFSAGDYLDLTAYQDSGGALNVSATGNFSPEFWAIWQSK